MLLISVPMCKERETNCDSVKIIEGGSAVSSGIKSSFGLDLVYKMEITVLKDNNEPKNVDLLHQAIKGARRCIKEPFVRLSVKIPRHIITIDEKYLRHCLELVYITSASNSPSWEPFSSKFPVFPAMNCNQLPISLTKRGHESVVSPGGEWIIGSITRSKSMLNILKSPLLHHKDKAIPITLGTTNLIDSTKSRDSDSDSNNSMSSRKPLVMDMLHLTWKPGSPHCVFSLDGRKEAYMAKMTGDCIYVFHEENESEIVGRMRMSTSVTLDQTDSEIKETEFVLFGDDNGTTNETVKRTPARVYDRLPRKVTRVFKKSLFLRAESKKGDSCAWPRQLDDHFLPNSELMAIVVKERVHNRQRVEEETRGWGVKFLKKMKKINNNDECSTSIDIVVPAGIHGGPRKREGGPSGLIQRWRSAGQCDCGGWDMGCSFKVLKTRESESKSKPDSQYRPSFELFTEGSSVPRMKMVNVDDNLYIIHFESGISALQTFATAVAIIHCRSPSHQLKQVGELKTQQDHKSLS